jgi:hypothetical protein
VNRSKFTGKEVSVERQAEFKPYVMGMQVPCGMDTEVSEESDLRATAEIFGVNIQGTRDSERESGYRGSSLS